MKRNLILTLATAATTMALATGAMAQAQFGNEAEAKAMLEKAIAAVKTDKAKALDTFNKGEGGFKDRDLYPFCANASDGIITAHPALKGKQIRELKDKDGKALGEEIMNSAAEGKTSTVEYKWPRPSTEAPVPKVTFVTKVADQVCAVGYYK